MSTKVHNKIKNVLYVPPHARKSNISKEVKGPENCKRIKLCDDSNLLFKAAEKTEERYFQSYLEFVQKSEHVIEKDKDSENSVLNDCSEGMFRPRTCTVSAKRLVSNALGIKPVLSNSEQEEMFKIIAERELKRQNNLKLKSQA